MEYTLKNIISIADTNIGDIGNTSNYYARTFYDTYGFDAITIAPYMGSDSVTPFLRDDKWAIILGLTSNSGAMDFQNQVLQNGLKVYEQVIQTCSKWGSEENMMFVIGATQDKYISAIREKVPNHFFLVPGVGAQGGSLNAVAVAGLNKDIGLLINSSRGIIYASNKQDFDLKMEAINSSNAFKKRYIE